MARTKCVASFPSTYHEIHDTVLTGRVPGSATYTKLRVGQSDSIKLSLLHGSGNHKLLQGEGIIIIIYLRCMEVGMKVVE